MFENKTIICISPIDWDFLWQRHQILSTFFAKDGHKVIYIENLNPTATWNLALIPKLFKRLFKIFHPSRSLKNPKHPNITVITPFVIPFKNQLSNWINKKLCVRILARTIKKSGAKNPLVWTYQATSLTQELINTLHPEFLVYDCVFDAPLHPNSPADIEKTEDRIIQSANLVLTDNRHLFEKCLALNPHTHMIPPGVDDGFFLKPAPLDPSTAIFKVKKPRICFFGGIDNHRLDLELICAIAEYKPDWSLIFIGPVIKTDISCLHRDNIHLYPPIEHSSLPSYLEAMDALILPYKLIPFSKSIFPAKIFECLATGKPVVATPLEELVSLDDGIIQFGRTRDELISQLEDALHHDTSDAKIRRLALAKANSWKKRFSDIKTVITQTENPSS